MGNKRVENVPGQSLRTEYTQAHKLSSTQAQAHKLSSTQTQGTKDPEGNRVGSSPEDESSPGFLELKCKVHNGWAI